MRIEAEKKFFGVLRQFPCKWEKEKRFHLYTRWFEKPSKRYPRGRKRKRKSGVYFIDYFSNMPIKIAWELQKSFYGYERVRETDMERRGILLIKIEDKFCDDYYTIFNLLKKTD